MLWINGRIQPGPSVAFDLSDRGLLLADGLFETMACSHGAVIWRDEHLARLAQAAADLAIPCDLALAGQALDALAAADPGAGAVRLTLTRGPAPRGLRLPDISHPTLFATRAPWRAQGLFQPITLATSPIRRNSTSPTSRLKTLAYLDGVLGLRQALAQGADDALFLNEHGRVACTSAGNLLLIRDGQLITPPVSDGVLPGITRARLLALAPVVGLQAIEASLSLADLVQADHLFTSNSLRFITPISAIDGVAVGRGGPEAPVMLALRTALLPAGLWPQSQ